MASFSYYTPYRVRSKGALLYPVLRGASQQEGDEWLFFSFEDDYPPVRRFQFEALHSKKDGSFVGWTADDRFEFYPLTVAEVRADPGMYGLTAEDAAAIQTPTDLTTWLVAVDVPEWYVSQYGPPEEQGESELEEALLGLTALEEARGIPAEVGAIHRWGDDHDYEKQSDGSWRRVDTEWSDTHPEVPKDTKDKYYSPTEGWDPQRRATHARLLKDVGGSAFEGKKPVLQGESPEFTYIMGPPAAGKSTRQSSREYDNTVKLDPDEFVERMPEFLHAQKVKARNGAQSVFQEAQMLNDKLMGDAMEGRYNFIVSGTGGSLDWMQKELFPELKRRGYRINVVMTYVDDLDELMLRTEARGHARGRFIPGDRTQRLHATLPKNFKALMSSPEVTSLALINSHQDARRGEAKNEFVYQQFGDQKAVLDSDFFDSFMEKTK